MYFSNNYYNNYNNNYNNYHHNYHHIYNCNHNHNHNYDNINESYSSEQKDSDGWGLSGSQDGDFRHLHRDILHCEPGVAREEIWAHNR